MFKVLAADNMANKIDQKVVGSQIHMIALPIAIIISDQIKQCLLYLNCDIQIN
jgi:hypothetical protein